MGKLREPFLRKLNTIFDRRSNVRYLGRLLRNISEPLAGEWNSPYHCDFNK